MIRDTLFKDMRQAIKKVLMIGIGTGTSLRMWRDFFPNAKIHGVDYVSDRLINEGRIESILCDQRRKKHLLALIDKIGPDIDLVIDDGSHRPRDQVFTCLTLMPLLNTEVTYVIEDVTDLTIVDKLGLYDVGIPKNRQVVVKHKKMSKDMQNIDTFKYIVNKYKINVGRQHIIEIPDIGSAHLAKLFAELGFNKGAEVGVSDGEYSEILCKANPKLHLYSIDSWSVSSYKEGFLEQSNPKRPPVQQQFENYYRDAVKKLAPFNCKIIRKKSMEAVKDFEDGSLDFVYLDAGHDFLNFTLDIHYWKDKVREGGILSGHDYWRYRTYKGIHVMDALYAYAKSYKMIPFFVIPSTKKYHRRDLYGSWFLVKTKEWFQF